MTSRVAASAPKVSSSPEVAIKRSSSKHLCQRKGETPQIHQAHAWIFHNRSYTDTCASISKIKLMVIVVKEGWGIWSHLISCLHIQNHIDDDDCCKLASQWVVAGVWSLPCIFHPTAELEPELGETIWGKWKEGEDFVWDLLSTSLQEY